MASRNIKDLDKRIQPLVRQLLDVVVDGHEPFITDGFRSNEEQTKLYNQGRTTPGKIVTHAKAGQSPHNYGLAVDLAWRRPGTKEARWVVKYYKELAKKARELDFDWGGSWSNFRDNPHYELKNWRSYKKNSKPIGGNMSPSGDKIEIDKKTFEELVTKSSKYDEFQAIGYTSAAQVKKDIDDYKKSISEKNKTISVEKQRAEDNRAAFNDLLVTTAKAVDSVQEINQVTAKLEEARVKLETVEDLERQVAELQLVNGEEKEELRAEVRRLKALLDHENVLKNSTVEEMIGEIIQRLTNIIGRSRG